MAFKIFFALCVLGPILVQGYSGGAPDSECKTMTPRHHVDPQSGPSPYDIILDKKNIRAGETVLVTIKGRGKDDTIKGLLVQARIGETPIGQFDVDQSRQYVQVLSCDGGRNVSVELSRLISIIIRGKNSTVFVECLLIREPFCEPWT